MLVCLGLGAVSAQGLIGPMNGELAATLPAHMKNFGLSLYIFFQNLLQPCYVAIMGVGLQVITPCCSIIFLSCIGPWDVSFGRTLHSCMPTSNPLPLAESPEAAYLHDAESSRES